MVKIIENSIFRGIAGKRPSFKPSHFVLHNDAGSMTPEQYGNWLKGRYMSGQSGKGFAHYYINRNTIARYEDTYNRAWACGNPRYNNNTISYEVCEQLKVSDAEFLENENMVLRQMAADMYYYKMTPNANNIKFHNEMSSTSCPARSLKLHGGSNNTLREYVIDKIKYYQSFKTDDVKKMLELEKDTKENGAWKSNDKGYWYEVNGAYIKDKWKFINNKWYYFESDGYMAKDKWIGSYYVGSDGAMLTDTRTPDNYYVDKNGVWSYGQWKSNDTGWWYEFANGSYIKNEWEFINGTWYWFEPNGYIAVSTWKKIDGAWYWFNSNGNMKANGWELINDKWYYFNANGSMKQGWVNYYDKWYYLSEENGEMISKAFKEVNGEWYYFKEDGTMVVDKEVKVDKSGYIDYQSLEK